MIEGQPCLDLLEPKLRVLTTEEVGRGLGGLGPAVALVKDGKLPLFWNWVEEGKHRGCVDKLLEALAVADGDPFWTSLWEPRPPLECSCDPLDPAHEEHIYHAIAVTLPKRVPNGPLFLNPF